MENLMEYRTLGKTGLKVSAVGFGCGAIGGLLVRGSYPDMRATVARALELGVNYFDTASLYGNGQSEVNLGAVLRELGEGPGGQAIVGTKVRLGSEAVGRIGAAVTASVEASLRRLGREQVDLIQFHNKLGAVSNPTQNTWSVAQLLEMAETFAVLQQAGKARYWGFNGLGEGAAIRAAIHTDTQYTMQSCYNLLNPSAGRAVGDDFPYDNYSQAIDEAGAHGVGVIAIRVLAGGALAGTLDRHPVAAATPDPLGSAQDYASDVIHAQRFAFLVHEGYAANLAEAAIRFVISKPAVSTALVGISTAEQLEAAVVAAERGALPAAVLERIAAI
jgi:aryl-alcohol dehydrogenase-like predicted oxidoreductase